MEEKKNNHKWGEMLLLGILIGIGITVVIVALFEMKNRPSSESEAVIDNTAEKKIDELEAYIDEYYYFNDDVTTEDKQNGLYKGLLEALDDPYSEYYTAEELEEMAMETEGIYYGIGAYVSTNEAGYPVIVSTFEGSPAEEVGILSGDIIYKVEDEDVTSLSLTDVVSKLKGEEGTKVHVTLIRDSEEVEVDVERRKIDVPTVTSKMLDDNIGYIEITEFDEVTTDQFKEALEDLKSQGMEKMILDLRNNPGGNVDTVVDIASMMLPEGLVFYMEYKDGERIDYTCDGADFDYPLVVLVNGYSASASEILSGAIQDAEVGTIVGTQTYGKGIVQTIFSLKDGSGLKLTVAGYYTRGGQNIHKIGITPDVEIELDSEAYLADGTDNQLEKAKEILKDKN